MKIKQLFYGFFPFLKRGDKTISAHVPEPLFVIEDDTKPKSEIIKEAIYDLVVVRHHSHFTSAMIFHHLDGRFPLAYISKTLNKMYAKGYVVNSTVLSSSEVDDKKRFNYWKLTEHGTRSLQD